MVSAAGCGIEAAEPAAPKNTVPVVGVALDQTMPSNNGLLKMLDGNGVPVRDGAVMDAAILEARRILSN